MPPLKALGVVLICVAVWIAVSGGGGAIIGAAPPFKTSVPAILIVEESAEHGKYTADQLNVISATDAGSVKAIIESAGGQFQVIDKDVPANALAMSAPWVQEAFKVKRDSSPWVVGASSSTGFSVPLTNEADILTLAKGLK